MVKIDYAQFDEKQLKAIGNIFKGKHRLLYLASDVSYDSDDETLFFHFAFEDCHILINRDNNYDLNEVQVLSILLDLQDGKQHCILMAGRGISYYDGNFTYASEELGEEPLFFDRKNRYTLENALEAKFIYNGNFEDVMTKFGKEILDDLFTCKSIDVY